MVRCGRFFLTVATALVLGACGSVADPGKTCVPGVVVAGCEDVPGYSAWPGADDARTVDAPGVLGVNISGLTHEIGSNGQGVLWAVRNDPGVLMRLVVVSGLWTPDPVGGWLAGRTLRYPDNTGNPDAEGVTLAGGGVLGGVYVAAERNNSASSISRNSILRYDAGQGTAELRATHEWNLTNDLPSSSPNLGIEAVTWIPDSMLVANGFVDESTGQPYLPANYASHGTGLFFVGLEADGNLYAYALNHTTSAIKRVATIVTGFAAVMGMEYDRDTGMLWMICDNNCQNDSGVLSIASAGSSTSGKFRLTAKYTRPSSLPNVNNEGFALAPNTECVSNRKPAFWSDDSNTGGNVLRRASAPCGSVSAR